ncbi:hypothetical protein [Immundisolibacter cernigliae]|uniref:hypothetical protein n=1 Tax=Immundisolibacter cernigliae TaxID=1810504 RepID=UPI001F369725|nr:hypothetical protein [Immundisolibacter cernigliae]
METATEEQIRTASCAFMAMSKPAQSSLLRATEQYLKSKDSVSLIEAFQIDEVPNALGRCSDVHAAMTMKARPSNRDVGHFFDGSERALRLLVLEKVARTQGASAKEIKKIKDKTYEGLMQFNEEHY